VAQVAACQADFGLALTDTGTVYAWGDPVSDGDRISGGRAELAAEDTGHGLGTGET